MPEKIQKRDGRLETWSVERIARAILKSLRASGIKDPVLARRLAGKVEEGLAEVAVPEQEDVQDLVEQVLMESRLFSVAKKYILYRSKRREIRSQDEAFLDVTKTIDGYVNGAAPSLHGQTGSHSFQGLSRHLAGAVQERYALEQYPEEIRLAHENGYLHIHHLSFGMAGYCAGWNLETLLAEGFGFAGVTCFGPPLHLDAVLDQMACFLGAMQGEWVSTQSFSHVDTLLAPFVRADNLGYEQVRECIRTFVLRLNALSPGKDMPPHVSLGFDCVVPSRMAAKKVLLGREHSSGIYGEYGTEAGMISRAMSEVLEQGDALAHPLPVPTTVYTLPVGFVWSDDLGKSLVVRMGQGNRPYFRRAATYATPPHATPKYDAATETCFEGKGVDGFAEVARSACSGFPHGADALTGSIGVVSLNLPKLGFLAQGERAFLDLIAEYAEYARDCLEFKRKFMSDYMAGGMFPYSRHYLDQGLAHHVGTLAVVGGHEACCNLLGKGVDTPEGNQLMGKVLERLNQEVERFTQTTGHPYTVMAITENNACYRLAAVDKELYGEIISSGVGTPRYTNGVYLPPEGCFDEGFVQKQQKMLLPRISGGAVAYGRVPLGVELETLVKILDTNHWWQDFQLVCTESKV